MSAPAARARAAPEEAEVGDAVDRHELTLFVSGASPVSARAIASARTLCDIRLESRYRLTIVDVNEDPGSVVASGVVVVPTLVKHAPPPSRRYVGDLSQTDRVLAALGIRAAPDPSGAG